MWYAVAMPSAHAMHIICSIHFIFSKMRKMCVCVIISRNYNNYLRGSLLRTGFRAIRKNFDFLINLCWLLDDISISFRLEATKLHRPHEHSMEKKGAFFWIRFWWKMISKVKPHLNAIKSAFVFPFCHHTKKW